MVKKIKISGSHVIGRNSIDNIIRQKNPIKSIRKKFQYDFDAYSPMDSKIGRLTVYANNLKEAKKKARIEIKEYY